MRSRSFDRAIPSWPDFRHARIDSNGFPQFLTARARKNTAILVARVVYGLHHDRALGPYDTRRSHERFRTRNHLDELGD
jgi:hypothetical protein